MSSVKLDVNVSETDIQNAIAVSIAEAFPPEKRDQLLRDIVRAHLSLKQNPYDKETILSAAVGSQIRKIASDKMNEIVAGWRDEVGEIVEKAIGGQYKDSVMLQLQRSLSNITVRGLVLEASIAPEID